MISRVLGVQSIKELIKIIPFNQIKLNIRGKRMNKEVFPLRTQEKEEEEK